MKNLILLVLFVALGIISFVVEPVQDTVDVIAGSTSNKTYDIHIDGTGGVSLYDDDDDDHDEDDD